MKLSAFESHFILKTAFPFSNKYRHQKVKMGNSAASYLWVSFVAEKAILMAIFTNLLLQ
jgi:hypothetical protein